MHTHRTCEECGTELPSNAPQGLCPRCLGLMGLKMAANAGPAAGRTSFSGKLNAGETIGLYTLLERIGEGGCGVVYIAEQQQPVRRRVALKIIKLGMDTEMVVARFEAERQTLAMMDHPNIARVFDAGATETGRPYFVMELVPGARITDYCDQNNLSIRERLGLFIQVCQAIQHAHQKGIIHRDIKPSNVLVTPHDGVPHLKVIDFGIAKATADQPLTDKTTFTAFQQFLGTPAYMSPEQAEMSPDKSGDIDTRSDIYSLGVLLYELLTSKTPFDTNDSGLDEMRRKIREKEPLRPSMRLGTMSQTELSATAQHRRTHVPRLVHSLRGDLDWIVMKCLEKDRTRRYDTTNGLATDIQHHLDNEPVVARPPSTGYRFQKFVQRHKLALVAAAIIAVLLIAGVTISSWQAMRATRAEKHARAETTRAQAAQKIADDKSAVAEAQRARAEQQAEAIRLLSYVDAMNVAQRYCQEGNFVQALALLQSQPLREGKEDLRGFEWRYLYRLCRGNHSLTLPRHEQVLGAMQFSPNGRMLATYCWDRKLRLWDLDERSNKPVFEVSNAAGLGGFSADGQSLVFGSVGGRIDAYRLSTREVSNIRQDAGETFAFSPTANVVLTIAPDKQIKVWNLATAELRFSLPGGQRRYLEFGWTDPATISPDGKWLAVIDPDEGPEALQRDRGIRLWDLESGRELEALKDARQIRSLCFSPNGRFLAAGDGQGNVHVRDLTTREVIRIMAHGLPVLSLTFSPDGKVLATGSSDETIKLWDAATGRERPNHFRGQGGSVSSLAFSPDGRRLACGNRNSRAKIWDFDELERGETVNEIRDLHTKEYANFAFSPNGRSMAAGCHGDKVVVWDVETLHTNSVLEGMRYVVAFTSDSKHLLAADAKNTGYWCDLETKSRRRLPGHSGDLNREVYCVALAPDGRTVALGFENGTIELWELDTGKAVGSLQAHAGRVRTLSFSHDGDTLVSGGSDSAVKLWDVKRLVKTGEKIEHKGAVCAAVISHSGTRLASGCGFGTIKLWDPQNLSNALVTVVCHKSALRSLDFSPQDGKTLASGGEDKTVKLWNMASLLSGSAQREVASFRVTDSVRLVQFSPDNNVLAIVTDDGVLRLLRAVSLKEADEETEALQP
jgi:WD40 repeat protein/serine/threonine protein kinase